jgi:hypothetical protein
MWERVSMLSDCGNPIGPRVRCELEQGVACPSAEQESTGGAGPGRTRGDPGEEKRWLWCGLAPRSGWAA